MAISDLREQVTALLNANCYDGCESGADEMRACVYPPCPCRTLADKIVNLVLEKAAERCDKIAMDVWTNLGGKYTPWMRATAEDCATDIRALKEKSDD